MSKRGEQRLHRFRPPQDPHGRLGDDRQRAFGADEHAEQIEPGRVERRAPPRCTSSPFGSTASTPST